MNIAKLTMVPDVLAEGYQVAEAPRADGTGGVYFSDAKGGGVFHWTEAGVRTVLADRVGVGGMALHADGGLVVGGPDLAHVSANGDVRPLLDLPAGAAAWNDMCALEDGTLMVGALPDADAGGGSGTFIAFDGTTSTLLLGDVAFPNGCGTSLDGNVLFACDYLTGEVRAREHGHWRSFGKTPAGEADGLAVDSEGGVWVAQPRDASIVRLSPDGVLDHVIELPGWHVTSLAFDGAAMYLTTAGVIPGSNGGALLRVASPVSGRIHLKTTV